MEDNVKPTGYELQRMRFDFASENPKFKAIHIAIHDAICDRANRLGWKRQFGLPSLDIMEMLSIGDKRTYLTALRDLRDWGFINIVQEAKNQYQSCVIELCYSNKTTALPTAQQQQYPQHNTDTNNGTTPIDKHINLLNSESNKTLKKEDDSFSSVDFDSSKNDDDTQEPKSSTYEKKEVKNSDLNKSLNDFLEMRKKIRKPATDRAVEMIKNELEKLSGGDESIKIQILDQSTMNSWQGVFPLKEDFSKKEKHSSQKEKESKVGSVVDAFENALKNS